MRLRCLGIAAGLAVWIAPGALGAPAASVRLEGTQLIVQPLVEGTSLRVTLTGPEGLARSQVLSGGDAALEVGEPGHPLADGDYYYEVRALPSVTDGGETGDVLPGGGKDAVLSGAFAVRSGRVSASPAQAPASPAPKPPHAGEQVIEDDLLVLGRLCAGANCSTATLQENLQLRSTSNRIRAEDTAVAEDDWQISFNDAGVGGVNRFSVENLSHGLTPFTIASSTFRDHALFIDGSGRVGLGTSTPQRALHITSSAAVAFPAVRLDGAPITGQVWDLTNGGNNFHLTSTPSGGSSRIVLRLDSQAPQNSLYQDHRGFFALGGGTAFPLALVHVVRNDGSTKLLVEEGSTTVTGRNLLQLKNNGPVTLRFDNASNGTFWGFGSVAAGNKFFVSAGGASSLSLALDPAGNLTIAGALTQSSDRNAKDDIAAVDPAQVLARLAELPIATWRYKGDEARHVGPMAQDFHAAFGLGPDDKHIAPADLAGLSLAAAQALRAEAASKAGRIAALEAAAAVQEARLRELADRLSALEGDAAPR